MAKRIQGTTRIFGKSMPYIIEFDDCYDVVKRGRGWSVTKDGEFVDRWIYQSKWAAASTIGRYVET